MRKIEHFFKVLFYLILVPTILWFASVAFEIIVAFSYTDHILSWIPFIILGGWVPWKWYGLTLIHSIICVAISFGVIGFFDKKLKIAYRARLIILILVSLLFLYEGIFNYFFKSSQGSDILQFRQFAILQLSFLVGILIKTFNSEADME